MSKNLKRLLALLMFAIMMLSMFTACVNNDDDEIDTDGEIEGTEEDPCIAPVDYDGHEFTFITRDGTSYVIDFLVSEGEEGEILDNAIMRRNALLQEKYNITINQLGVSDIVTEVRTQIMGGETEFDAILASCSYLAIMAQENLLYNLLDIDRFNWDASYWDSNSKDQLMIGDKLYFANCAFNIHAIGFCVYFNKKIAEDYKLTSPYEYMKNNEWTIDNWAKMVKSVSKDMDNDGVMTEFDQYGTLVEHHNTRMFLYASGVRATTNDENGYPIDTLMKDAEKTVNIYEKLKDVLFDTNYGYCMTCSSVGANGYAHKYNYLRYLFTQDLYMFHYTDDAALEQFAEMESEFGVVPFPKYDKNQELYQTIYPSNSSLLAIPSIVEDIDRTANIIEDMNYFSSFTIIPAWYDTLLARRYARDNESEESLKILRNNCVYDLGLYYDFGGVRSKVLDMSGKLVNVSRNYERVKAAIQSDIQNIYSDFAKQS